MNEKIIADGKRLQLARTLDDVKALRHTWEHLQGHPNADFEQYVWALEEFGRTVEPYVLLLKNGEGHEALLVGRKEKIPLDVKLGYLSLWRPQVKALTFIYAGYLGAESESNCRSIVKFICEQLRQGEADVAWFNSVATGSNLFRAIRTVPNYVCRDVSYLSAMHWSMSLPDSVETFWGSMSAKHRYWLKRLPKVLEKENPGKVRYRSVYGTEEVESICVDAEIVARKTYQRGLGVGFADSGAMRSRLGRIAAAGRLRSYLLYVNDVPVTFWIGQVYGKDFHLHYTGFNPEWRKYEVGTILFMRMIEDVIKRDAGKVERIDFGLGDASYKQRFGDKSWEEASLHVYASTIKGISINLAKASANRLRHVADGVLKRWKLEERVKRFMRKRAADGVKTEKMED